MNKIKLLVIGAIVLVICVGAGVGITVVSDKKKEAAIEDVYKADEVEAAENDEEVVNEPLDKSVVTLADGSDGHGFISEYHDFYNDTLGWGRVHSVVEDRQKTVAEEVIELLTPLEVRQKDIAVDLVDIRETAVRYINEGDVNDLIRLHRLFHDLDIYFNGYDYHQTFGITQYKGE